MPPASVAMVTISTPLPKNSSKLGKMNLQVKELSELITDQEMLLQLGGGEVVAPDTPSEL